MNSFVHFKSTMENKLGHKIKALRTYCEDEFTNKELKLFCSSHGIIHQFIYPHTLEQNGVAKCKHQHIIEISPPLISQSDVHLSYWAFVFTTSIFPLNRISFSSSHFKSTWDLLFHTVPDYTTFKMCYFSWKCFSISFSSSKLVQFFVSWSTYSYTHLASFFLNFSSLHYCFCSLILHHNIFFILQIPIPSIYSYKLPFSCFYS